MQAARECWWIKRNKLEKKYIFETKQAAKKSLLIVDLSVCIKNM